MKPPNVCQEFAERFGIELHDLYAAKYPINSDTKVVYDLVTVGDARIINYLFPIFPIEAPMGTASYGAAQYERWRSEVPPFEFALAFAPEINTVFVKELL